MATLKAKAKAFERERKYKQWASHWWTRARRGKNKQRTTCNRHPPVFFIARMHAPRYRLTAWRGPWLHRRAVNI